MIKVLFFASLRERMNIERLDIPSNGLTTALDVLSYVASMNEQYLIALKSPKPLVAVNQELSQYDSTVSDGDEVAFYPPVTGG